MKPDVRAGDFGKKGKMHLPSLILGFPTQTLHLNVTQYLQRSEQNMKEQKRDSVTTEL